MISNFLGLALGHGFAEMAGVKLRAWEHVPPLVAGLEPELSLFWVARPECRAVALAKVAKGCWVSCCFWQTIRWLPALPVTFVMTRQHRALSDAPRRQRTLPCSEHNPITFGSANFISRFNLVYCRQALAAHI